MNKFRRKFRSISKLILAALLPAAVLASPTQNEFDPCNKIAVYTLEHCLESFNNQLQVECWENSEKEHRDCVSRVFKSHDRSGKLESIRREEALKRIAEQEEANDGSDQPP